MANYPINIWMISENEFDEFTCTGGKVIYIVEEPDPRFATHPAIVTAGALLPPIEAIQAELDGRMFEASSIYEQYLQREEADSYISILLAVAIKQIPVGIMFGKDENNMQFPKMLLDFVYKHYGLVIGLRDKILPYLEEAYMPFDLAKLYNMNIIDCETFMTKHPLLPIHDMAISKLIFELNPIVAVKDMQHYKEYFEMLKNEIHSAGKYLVDPLEAL